MPPDAATGSLNLSPGSQDARRGTNNFATEGASGIPCASRWQRCSKQGKLFSPATTGSDSVSRDFNPMSQDARLASRSIVRRGELTGPTPATAQQGRRAAPIGDGAHTRVGLPPPPSLCAARRSQDSRAVAAPIRQRPTGDQRHQERIDLMEIEPVQGQAPQEDNTLSRKRARIGPPSLQ